MKRMACLAMVAVLVTAGCSDTDDDGRASRDGNDGGGSSDGSAVGAGGAGVAVGAGGAGVADGAVAAETGHGGDGEACHWPGSLVPVATGSRSACVVARYFLQCGPGNDITGLCLSDDPTACQGPNAIPHCTDQCEADEYAVSCGGPPVLDADGSVQPTPLPPSACRSMGGTPGGNVFYCCPCASS